MQIGTYLQNWLEGEEREFLKNKKSANINLQIYKEVSDTLSLIIFWASAVKLLRR